MSQERRLQSLCQGDINGIIGRQICAQSPYPAQQKTVRMALDGKIDEIVESRLRPQRIDFPNHLEPPDYLGNLDIEQVR